jgi:hypothetical protein
MKLILSKYATQNFSAPQSFHDGRNSIEKNVLFFRSFNALVQTIIYFRQRSFKSLLGSGRNLITMCQPRTVSAA